MDSATATYTLFHQHPPPESRACSTLVPKSCSLHYSHLRPTRQSQPLPLFMDSSTAPQISSSPPFPPTFHSSFRIASIPTRTTSLTNYSNEQFSNSAFPFTGPGPVALVTFPVQPSEPPTVPRASINKPQIPPRPYLSAPQQPPPVSAPKSLSRQVPVSRPQPVPRRPATKFPTPLEGLPAEPPQLPSRPPVGPPVSNEELPRALERPLPGPRKSRFSAPPSRLRQQQEALPGEFSVYLDDDSMELPSTPNMIFDPPYASSPTQISKVTHDPFFSSNLVIGLDATNFTKFLNTRDVVAVMFYDSKLPESRGLEKVVSQAACSTKRANHTYAGVDCSANMNICKQHNATNLPSVRIYAKMFCLGELKNPVFPDTLRQRVEMAPPAEGFRMV